MEKFESPTKNQNSIGRNVLKEWNNVDGVTKSPNQLSLKDEAVTKESTNVLRNVPDIISHVGKVEDFIHSTPLQVASYKSAVKTNDVSFVEHNTTFNTDTKVKDVNNTIEYVAAVLDETSHILGKQSNETVIICDGENANVESSAENLVVNIDTENQDVAPSKKSKDIKRLTLPILSASEDIFSTSLESDIKIVAPTDIAAGTQLASKQKQKNKSLSATEDLHRLNETVNIVPNADLQQNIDLEQIKKVNSKDLSFVVSSSVDLDNEEILNIANVETIIENKSEDTQQSKTLNEAGTGNSHIPDQFINDSYVNNATTNDNTGTDAQMVADCKQKHKLLPVDQESGVKPSNLNETVDIVVPTADSKLTVDNTKGDELKALPLISYEESVALSNEKMANITNDLEDDKPIVTDIVKPVNVEAFNDSKASVKLSNLGETNRHRGEIERETRYQESTFILRESSSNRTTVLEDDFEQEIKAVAINENDLQKNELSTLKQGEKIREFKANQTISVDSLDANSETRDCSLDSIEMKQQLQHQPTIQSDEMMTDKDSAAISETLAISEPAIGSDLLTEDNSSLIMSVESEVPLVSGNVQNVSQSDFKSPLPPNPASIKMGNEQFQGGNTDFMVLNANDFDFLQSRGNNSFEPEEERRSSLLLRFDPLLKQRLSILPFAPAVHEESTEGEHSLHDIQPLVDLCSNTSSDNSSDGKGISTDATPPPPPTNEIAMSIGLVHNSNSMDNETEAYVNNIKSDRTEEKHVQIEGVPLTDKKIKFKHTDVNTQKKMEEYEATQDLLLKRITEKDKTVSKNCAIIEAYEKALAELVVEKEKLTENCEISNEKLRQERDIHYQHLMSLETTFSDLHMKYEKSKEFILQLQDRLDCVTEEKAKIDELLKQQEMRYEKMKEHALHQLEEANPKLEEQDRNNTRENSRLKAQLKMEEVTRSTFQEQLFQKKKENEELVKICDELIGGQKS